jgi:hypothetical protein
MKDELYEGLITTYPLDYSVRHLKKEFLYCIIDIVGDKKDNTIRVYFKEDVEREDIDNFIHRANTCGWFPSFFQYTTNDNKSEYLKSKNDFEKIKYGNINFMLIGQFEAKYDIELDERPIHLFHVTDGKNLEKIKKIGLVPRAKEKKSSHPERIYFTTDPTDAQTLAKAFKKMNNSEIVIICIIETSKVESLKLMKDPNYMRSGVYTLNNIPPTAIIKFQIYSK